MTTLTISGADGAGRRDRCHARLTKAADGVPGDNLRMTAGPSGLARAILFASFARHAAIRDAKIPQTERGSSR